MTGEFWGTAAERLPKGRMHPHALGHAQAFPTPRLRCMKDGGRRPAQGPSPLLPPP